MFSVTVGPHEQISLLSFICSLLNETTSMSCVVLTTLKAEKLTVDQWQDKEATRDAVRLAIKDFLWSDDTGLPVDHYREEEVEKRAEEVYRHVFRVYPEVPSPFYTYAAG